MSQSSESNGAMNAADGGGSGGASSSATSSATTNRLPRIPSISTGTSAPSSTSSECSALRTSRVGDARECAAGAACAEQAVGAVAGELLVPELLALGHLLREQLGRQQPLDDVVIADVAVAPREPDHAGDGVRLEDRAHRVLGHPEPVLRRGRSPARSRPRRVAHPPGGARAPALRRRRCPRVRRRGTAGPCGPRSRGTRGTRSPG